MASFQNPQLDYSLKSLEVLPSYTYSKIFQQTGGQDHTVAAGATESIFELPARCINLSRSTLKYTSTPTAGGANKFNWMFADVIAHIRQIQLYTRGGAYVCDINNVDKMSSVTLKAETYIDEAEVVDTDDTGVAARAGELDDTFGSIRANGTLTITTAAQVDAVAPDNGTFGGYVGDVVTNVVSTNPNFRYDATEAIFNPHEPQYLKVGGDTANTTTPVQNMSVPLSKYKNTILSLDKDFYFGEVMILKITWNPYAAWGFMSESDDNPSAVAITPLAGAITLTKLALYCALETNPVICAGLISAVQNGKFATNIPYVYQYKHVPGAEASQNVTVRVNRAHGKFLKKIYHILYDAAEVEETRYLHSNLGRDVCTSYHTCIDNNRRQEFNVTVADNDDWLFHKDALKGTLLSRMETYRYNWFVLDKFDDEICRTQDGCVDSGLPLDVERKWDFNGTCATTAYKHYTFVVVSRMLVISPQGLFIA